MHAFKLRKKTKSLGCFMLFGAACLSFTIKGSRFLRTGLFFSPPTDTVAVCGTSTTLNTYPVAGYTNPVWSDGSTGNSLTVTSSGDYWWQLTGPNIVTNGDFTAGNTGFTSNYVYKDPTAPCGGCNILGPEDAYSVYTDAHALHGNFDHFGDHTNNTSGPRNMLIVNGAPNANEIVWAQNITILPHTDYLFSVWVTSVNPVSPAVLQFSVNSSLLGTINLSSTLADGVWQYFTTTWNSGSISGTVPIALVNQNLIANGNDFAVDDIKFAPYYRQNIHVNLNPIPVLALTGQNEACDAFDLKTKIVGYDPATYNYFFKDSGGNIVSAIITQSGTYTVIAQNKATGCTSLPASAAIIIDSAPPKPGITSL